MVRFKGVNFLVCEIVRQLNKKMRNYSRVHPQRMVKYTMGQLHNKTNTKHQETRTRERPVSETKELSGFIRK